MIKLFSNIVTHFCDQGTWFSRNLYVIHVIWSSDNLLYCVSDVQQMCMIIVKKGYWLYYTAVLYVWSTWSWGLSVMLNEPGSGCVMDYKSVLYLITLWRYCAWYKKHKQWFCLMSAEDRFLTSACKCTVQLSWKVICII